MWRLSTCRCVFSFTLWPILKKEFLLSNNIRTISVVELLIRTNSPNFPVGPNSTLIHAIKFSATTENYRKQLCIFRASQDRCTASFLPVLLRQVLRFSKYRLKLTSFFSSIILPTHKPLCFLLLICRPAYLSSRKASLNKIITEKQCVVK